MEDFYRPSLIHRGGLIAPTIDAEVYYDTTNGVSAHYSETTSALSAQIESDEDEPSEVLDIQKPIHSLSGNPTPSTDSVVDILFDVDHIEEESSGSTTSHSDLSLLEYESFLFDISIDPLQPADRSYFYHEEFANELAHILSPPEYGHFYFDLEDDPRELTRLLKENVYDTPTKDLKINELNDFPLLLSDCDSTFSKEFSEIDLLRFHILLLDYFTTISFISDSLFLTDPSEIKTFLSFPSRNEDKVFDLGIIIINGVFSFMRKSPHLLIDNFMIDKCHILSEISLKIESSVSFQPKDKEIPSEIPFDREDLHACFQSSNHSVSDHLHVHIFLSGKSSIQVINI
ncbi:hypothetical protein Tco_0976019 [Tanacetum coccineum]|uniref:Reverse transcriptase domain-containing protein n=1 Tax=Tanacetum coccineum TaxID=301880 RepID=A0ABQ5EGC5_9ASTR